MSIEGVQLRRELGRGAASVVYRGERDGREYAVKVLTREAGRDGVVSFAREAALLATLRHPGLVEIHEVGQAGGCPYLIMELVEGRSLASVIRDAGLSGGEVAALGARLADVLTVAHRAGLVHRDLKPDNVLVEPDGRIRLIDFGLATRAGDQVGDAAVGTFVYSAPEQTGMLRRPVDGRADLYALGVVLYECLAGAPPFRSDDAGELIRLHLTAPVPGLGDHVDPALSRVVTRLLAKDPDDRYPTAGDLRRDLAPLAGDRLGPEAAPAAGRLPLVGRSAELSRVLSGWRRTLTGQGELAVITGAPGSGRTRLADELAARAAAAGKPVLRGVAERENRAPLAPVVAAVEHHLAEVTRLPSPERARAAITIARAAGPAAAVLAEVAPALRELIEVPAEPGTATVDDDRFAEAVVGFLTGLATGYGGAVLLLDDAQWWDEATRILVGRLATTLSESPLLVLATADDDTGLPARTRVELAPLPPAGVAELVAAALGGGPAPETLVARIAARSAGNPPAVLEYLRTVLESGVLLPYWGGWRVDEAGLDELHLPANIVDLLLRRVDQLEPATRTLLEVAAAIGDRFTAEVAATVVARWGTVEVDVAAALDEALGHRLVEPSGAGYAFPDERIRQVLLEPLDDDRRRGLHQDIAHALTTDDVHVVAYHCLRGETDRYPAELYAATAAAGRRALAEYASAQAYAYLERAEQAAAAAGIEPDAAFHTAYAMAAGMVGRSDVADRQTRLALAKEPDEIRRATLYSWLAEAYHVQWEGRRAMELAERGLVEIGRPMPKNPLLLGVTTAGRMIGAPLLRLLPPERRLLDGRERERARVEVRLLTVIRNSAAYAMRMNVVAVSAFRGSYVAARLGFGPEAVDEMISKAMGATFAGRPKLGEKLFAGCLAAAERLGDPAVLARAHLAYALGRDAYLPPDARTGELFKAALTDHGRLLPASDYLLLAAQLGLFELMRGHLDEARRWYDRSLRRVVGNSAYGNPIMALGASIAAVAGQPAEAAARMRGVQNFADGDPDNVASRANAAVTAAHVALEQGELGAPFEKAIGEFHALKLTPRKVFTVQRFFWVFQAYGRLTQAAADPAPDRTAAAETAVRELRGATIGTLLGAYATVAEAWLEHLRGRPAEALRRLATLDAAAEGYNSALADHEAARVRARALAALDRPAEALRHAQFALQLAAEHGWQTRARWVRQEFDLAAQAGSVHRSVPRSSGYDSAAEVGPKLRRLQAVHQVSVAAAAILEPRQVCRVALDETVRILAAERAFLFLVDADTDELQPYLGRDAEGADLRTLTGYGASLVDRVRDTAEALVVTGSEQGAALGSASTLVHGLRSIVVAPVRFRERLLGVLYLDSRAARGIFTTDDLDVLSAIGHQLAVTFETARAATLEADVRTAERERELADMLRLAMTELSGTLEPQEVTRRMVALIGQVVPVDSWWILRPSETDETDPVLRRLHALDEPLHGTDAAGDLGATAAHLGDGTRAWMALPLVARGDRRGVLLVGTGQERTYTDGEARIVATLAGQGMTAYDNASLFRQIEELATRDGLTGLYNRRRFAELASPQPGEPARSVAAVMVDIDFFKKINDTYGHGVGDQVITEVAARLSRCLRATDIICRYGGEEFAVLLTDSSAAQAAIVAARLHATVCAEPIVTDAGPLDVTVSVGVTEPGGHPAALQTLLDQADTALYAAKRAGRNQVSAAGVPDPSATPGES